MKTRALTLFVLAAASSAAFAQGWSDSYSKALGALGKGDFVAARQSFQDAIALRPEDQSDPTSLPGPVTDPRRWRDGAPYSPNFGSAYCTFRMADAASGTDRTKLFDEAARQFETLLTKGQASPEAFYFLMRIYTATRDVVKQNALQARLGVEQGALKWKVDGAVITPEERAAVASLVPRPQVQGNQGSTGAQQGNTGSTPPKTTVIKASDLNTSGGNTAIGSPVPPGTSAIAGRVPTIDTKYAIVIGNSESMMPDAKVAFASSDAMMIREALVQHAGYAEENVDVVVNATASQIMASVGAIADRMPLDGTVLIYFTGAGYNISGKDYYAGIDAESPQDSMHMVAVMDVYKKFLSKGANIFAFNQASRTISSGAYFGKETALYGRVAQMEATIPGGPINSLVVNGTEVGAYTKAVADVLADWRSDQVPIMEFVWQVFYKMRQGGGPQTPTLPVLTVLSSDARF